MTHRCPYVGRLARLRRLSLSAAEINRDRLARRCALGEPAPNRIHAVLADHGLDRAGGFRSGPGRAWLAGLRLPPIPRMVIEDCLAVIDALQRPSTGSTPCGGPGQGRSSGAGAHPAARRRGVHRAGHHRRRRRRPPVPQRPRLVRETGKPIAQVAREPGINEGTLGNWCAQFARRADRAGNRAAPRPERPSGPVDPEFSTPPLIFMQTQGAARRTLVPPTVGQFADVPVGPLCTVGKSRSDAAAAGNMGYTAAATLNIRLSFYQGQRS
jgi:transposase-like protein